MIDENRFLKKRLVLWRVVYVLSERRIEKVELVKELKTRWRCKQWVNGEERGLIEIGKDKLESIYYFQDSKKEAIKAAIKRISDKLKEYKDTIPLLEKEIRELQIEYNILK